METRAVQRNEEKKELMEQMFENEYEKGEKEKGRKLTAETGGGCLFHLIETHTLTHTHTHARARARVHLFHSLSFSLFTPIAVPLWSHDDDLSLHVPPAPPT